MQKIPIQIKSVDPKLSIFGGLPPDPLALGVAALSAPIAEKAHKVHRHVFQFEELILASVISPHLNDPDVTKENFCTQKSIKNLVCSWNLVVKLQIGMMKVK